MYEVWTHIVPILAIKDTNSSPVLEFHTCTLPLDAPANTNPPHGVISEPHLSRPLDTLPV